MNPIPNDDELHELEIKLRAWCQDTGQDFEKWLESGGGVWDAYGNKIFPELTELERLDKKYAHIFDEIEAK